MRENIIKIGQKIDMTRYSGSMVRKEGTKTYVSQLLDIKADDRVYVAMPMDGGKLYLLESGERYSMYFYTQGGLYHCVARVENRYRSNQIYLAEMVFVSELEKFQRRQFYRMNCIIDVAAQKVGGNYPVEKGIIVDISGGGARFNTKRSFNPEDELSLEFWITIAGKQERFSVIAKVISSNYLVNRSESSYENRVEFLNMSEDKREQIVKYIFEEERRRRQMDRK